MRYGRLRVVGLASGLAVGLAAVLAGSSLAIPAGAQSQALRSVADPNGRFMIDVPANWQVKLSRGDMPALAAASEARFPNVNVVVELLPSPLSAEAYARKSEVLLHAVFHDYTMVQEGPTRIGEFQAYYRYFTWRTNTGEALFQLQGYFAVGTQGFVVTGTTLNDPERIRADAPILSQIIGTFRPSPASQ